MFKMAIEMFWIERKKALGLILSITATLSVCLIFMQFFTNPNLMSRITQADIQLFTESYAKVLLGFGILVVCISLIGYSCQYYNRTNSRQIGMLKLSGLNEIELAVYQFIQLIIIMVASIIISFVLSLVFVPMSLFIIYNFIGIQDTYFYYNLNLYLTTIAIIPLIMILIIFLEVQYSITNDVCTLITTNNNVVSRKSNSSLSIPDFVYLLMYVVGLYTMYIGDDVNAGFAVSSCIGAIGAYGMFYYWLPHTFDEMIDDLVMKGEKYVVLGDLALFMQQSKTLILFIMVSVILLPTFILASVGRPTLRVSLHVALILINILLSSSLINRFSIDQLQKNNHYVNLMKMGLTRDEVRNISTSQGNYFYLVLWIFTGCYLASIFLTFYLKAGLSMNMMFIILLEYIIPYLVSQIIVYINKRRTIKCL